MRYFFLLFSIGLLLAGSSPTCLAQKSNATKVPKGNVDAPTLVAPAPQITDSSILNAVEQEAVSGFNISAFIADNFSYPPAVLEDSNFVAVRVMVEFIVEKDASISGIKIVKLENKVRTSLLPDTERLLKQEVMRVMHKMPKWESPAYQNGESVKSRFTLPIKLISE